MGDSGPDVAELSRALVSAGYLSKPISKTTLAGDTLVKAVDRLLKNAGYSGAQLRPAVSDTNAGAALAKTGSGSENSQTVPAAPNLVAKATWFVQVSSGKHEISSVSISVGTVISDLAKPLLELDAKQPEIQAWLDGTSAKVLTAGATGSVAARDSGIPNGIPVTVASIDNERTVDPNTQSKGFRTVMTPVSALPQGRLPDHIVRFTVPLAQPGTPTVPETAVFTDPSESVPIKIGTCAEGWCTYEDPSQRVAVGTRVLISE